MEQTGQAGSGHRLTVDTGSGAKASEGAKARMEVNQSADQVSPGPGAVALIMKEPTMRGSGQGLEPVGQGVGLPPILVRRKGRPSQGDRKVWDGEQEPVQLALKRGQWSSKAAELLGKVIKGPGSRGEEAAVLEGPYRHPGSCDWRHGEEEAPVSGDRPI